MLKSSNSSMIDLSLFLTNGIPTEIVFPLKIEVNMFGTFPRDYQISQHSQKKKKRLSN